MIDRLTKQAAEEAEAKSFCDGEMSKSKATLEEQTKALQEEISAMDAGQAEATRIRQSEHEEFVKSSKDQKDSAEAVANAIAVLSDYYNKGSFLQVSVTQAPELGGAKTDVASTIMSMLEVAESDFTRMLAENEAQESAAQAAYDKLVQDNTVTRAAKQAEIKGNESELKSLARSLNNYK